MQKSQNSNAKDEHSENRVNFASEEIDELMPLRDRIQLLWNSTNWK